MCHHARKVLSRTVLRVDSVTPFSVTLLSETLVEMRRQRATHVAVFSQGQCLGVSTFNHAVLASQGETHRELVDVQTCTVVAESQSVEELGRLFADPTLEALLVHNESDEFVGFVTRQSLLEGLLVERHLAVAPSCHRDVAENKRAEALLAGEKRVLEIISTSSSPDRGFAELVEFVESHSDGVLCSIMLMDDGGTRLRNAASNSLPDAMIRAIDGLEIGPNAGACGTTAFLDETVVVTDIASDPRCKDIRDLALNHELRACWSSPIHSSSGKVLGTIAMYFHHPQSPDADHKALIGRATDLAAIAIERKQAEDALTRSEQKLSRAQQIAHVGSFELTADGSPAFWSDECFRIVGLNPNSGVPTRMQYLNQIIHPDDLEHSQQIVRRALEKCERYDYEYRVLRPDGSIRWVHSRGEPIYDEAGQLVSIEGAMLDITERREAEDSLRASETRNRTLLEGSPVCTKIIDLDSRLRYMSRAGQTQLKIAEIEPFYGSLFPPKLYPAPMRELATAHLERAKTGETTNVECCVLDTEGNELWYDTTFVPARDEDGRIQYIIVTSVNITERREMEEELSTIFNMSLDLICVSEIDTVNIVKANSAFLRVLGYSDEDLLGRTFLDFIHPDDVGRTVEIIERDLKKGKKVMRFENRCRTKGGDYRWMAWTINPNLANGLSYSIAHDITESKKADEQTRKLRDELAHVSRIGTMGEMATGIAHELNQPLAAIATYSYVAKSIADRIESGPDELRDALAQLEDQAIRAGDIVRRLRDFVKKNDSDHALTDLCTLVRNVASFVKPDICQAETAMLLEFAEPVLQVQVDVIQIQQVLVNLIRNAIDAMHDTPTVQRKVTVSTRRLEDGRVEVAVHDTGKGLPLNELEQVFNAFFSTKQEGMGMGLAISRSIIEAHSGKLWAKPNKGPGSTFGFVIPCEPELNSIEPAPQFHCLHRR